MYNIKVSNFTQSQWIPLCVCDLPVEQMIELKVNSTITSRAKEIGFLFQGFTLTNSTQATVRVGDFHEFMSRIKDDTRWKNNFSAQKQAQVQRRGAAAALTAITSHLGSQLIQKLPRLWEIVFTNIHVALDPATFGKSLFYFLPDI
ncbi:hypothetical protein J6590_056564 [Homalodisca vitripennis]|nr:hypothetical protein J6590_056564 [Homalodisca vitripennis]